MVGEKGGRGEFRSLLPPPPARALAYDQRLRFRPGEQVIPPAAPASQMADKQAAVEWTNLLCVNPFWANVSRHRACLITVLRHQQWNKDVLSSQR